MKSRAVLTLTPGDYYCGSLKALEPDAVIQIDRTEKIGNVRLYVKNGFVYRGKIAGLRDANPDLLIVYVGTETAPIEARFEGTLVAPNAKVVVNATQASHKGAFFARILDVQANARIIHSPSSIPWQP